MDDHGSKVLIIDNCGVLPSYRRRGLAKRTVFEILQLCASVTEIHSVVLYLPSTPWIIARCADQSLPCRMDKCSEVQCPWKAVVSVWRPQDMAAWMSR